MKRFTAIFLTALLLFSLAACENMSLGTNPTYTESPIEDFIYEITESGDGINIVKYVGNDATVVIPSMIDDLPVTQIRGQNNENYTTSGAFQNCDVVTVVIPSSVFIIGPLTFKNCAKLKEIIIPDDTSLYALGNMAFQFCSSLESIDLSSTQITSLGYGTFEGCEKLKSVKLCESLIGIDERAFYSCKALEEIVLPKNIEKIRKEAFGYCTSLKSINIPVKLDLYAIDMQVFHNVPSLESIIFDEGREKIVGYAFFDTTSNVEIIIPASVKKISPYTFFIRGKAKLIFLGNCPESVDTDVFYGDPTIYYDPNTAGWDNCVWKDNHPMQPIEN